MLYGNKFLCRFLGISTLGQQDKKVETRMAVTLVVLSWIWAAMIVSPILIKDPNTQMDLLGYDKAAGMTVKRLKVRISISNSV